MSFQQDLISSRACILDQYTLLLGFIAAVGFLPNCEGSNLLGLLLVFLELRLIFEIISLHKHIFSVPGEVITLSHSRIHQRLANLARVGNFPSISNRRLQIVAYKPLTIM